jgi:hypothetical protein
MMMKAVALGMLHGSAWGAAWGAAVITAVSVFLMWVFW